MPPRRSRVAPAHHPGHNTSAGPLDGQPEPDLTLFTARKGPYLIEFKRLPPLVLVLLGPQARQKRQSGRNFFSRPAMAMRETLVTRAMLRYELRPTARLSTLAYHTARAMAAGTSRAWCPQPVHWYLA